VLSEIPTGNAESNRPAETAAAAVVPAGPLVTRKMAGDYCFKKYGFGKSSTLAKEAVKGTGPKFYKYGAVRSYYTLPDIDLWALSRLGPARTQADAKRLKGARNAP
jgi:hypothetical protein